MVLTSGNAVTLEGHQQRVADRIKALRAQSGLTLRQLSTKVTGYSHGYLSKVEHGHRAPSAELLAQLDRVFGQGGALVELQALADDESVARSGRSVVRHERDARRIRVFASSLVPSLLQTERYAAEVLRAGLPGARPADITAKAASRVARQRILDRDEPPFLWVLLDEAALARPVGGPAVMADQLAHILSLMALPHVVVQVVPFAAGAHPMLGGFLTILEMPDGSSIVHVESFAVGADVESARERALQGQRWDMAMTMSESPGASASILTTYREGYQ